MGITDRLQGNAGTSSASRLLPKSGINNVMIFAIVAVSAIITAIFAIMVPISVLESLTGATGLSEIFPATKAPLGNSARALFVIFSVLFISAIALVLLLSLRNHHGSNGKAPTARHDEEQIGERARDRNRMPMVDDDDDSLLAQKIFAQDEQRMDDYEKRANMNFRALKDDGVQKKTTKKGIVAIAAGAAVAAGTAIKSKIKTLPFMGGDDRVRSFDDLPKLRGADKHPDAPARRPLSANEDLGAKILDRDTPMQQSITQKSQANKTADIDDRVDDPTNFPTNITNIEADAAKVVEPATAPVIDPVIDDVHLQSENVQSPTMNEATDAFIADPIPNDTMSERDFDDSAACDAPPVRQPQAVNGLDSIDNLMSRFESVVARRSAKLAPASLDNNEDIDMQVAAKESHGETEAQNYRASELENIAQPSIKPASPDDIEYSNAPNADQLSAADRRVPSQRTAAIQEQAPAIQEQAPAVVVQPSIQPVKLPSAEENQLSEVAKQEDQSEAPDMDKINDRGPTDAQKAEMDSALKSALETLHKMNERSA